MNELGLSLAKLKDLTIYDAKLEFGGIFVLRWAFPGTFGGKTN